MNNDDSYLTISTTLRKKLEENVKNNISKYNNSSSSPLQPASLISGYKEDLKKLNLNFKMFDHYDKSNFRPALEDLENVKIVFGNLKNIGLVQANDFNFWILLTHTIGWSYMQHRWSNLETSSRIIDRYFQGQHAISRNGLARLWWMGYVTYRDDIPNKWQYTEMMLQNEDSDLARMVVESPNQNVNKYAVDAILNKITIAKKEPEFNGMSARNIFRHYFKKYNMFGGVKAWNILTKEENQAQCDEFLDDLVISTRES